MFARMCVFVASALFASATRNESVLPEELTSLDENILTLAFSFEGNGTAEGDLDESKTLVVGLSEQREEPQAANETLDTAETFIGPREEPLEVPRGVADRSAVIVPAPSNLSDREEINRAVRELFKSRWPTQLWKDHGTYTDEYLLLINPHWLQFPPPSQISYYVLAVLYTILMTLGVSGNCLVIFMFCRCKSLRTPANILVMNLAISDSLMMLKMPAFIYNCIYLGPALGNIGCQVYGFLGGLTGTTSIATLAAIALDRYFVVLYPLEPLKVPTRARARVCVLLAWAYGAIFSSMPLFGLNRYVPEGYLTSCSFDYLTDDEVSRTFIVVFFVAAWVIPFALISFCYAAICRAVALAANYSSSNTVRKLSNSNNASSRREQQRRRTEIRLAIVVLAVVALWFVSWTPYATVALLGFSGNQQLITPLVSMIPALFCKMASCVDPFVYAITHPRFRKEFARRFPFCGGSGALRKGSAEKIARKISMKRRETSKDKRKKHGDKEEGMSVSEEEVVMVDMRGSSIVDNSDFTSTSGDRRNGDWLSDGPWTTDGRLYRSFPAPGIRHPFGSWIPKAKKNSEGKNIGSQNSEVFSMPMRDPKAMNEIIIRSDIEPTTV
uniref:Rh7-like protein n=1 Tax=Ischnura asiatica TaxID=107828 RepID=A0A0C6FZE9_9ODON|nr:opsin, rhodopsin-7 like [Ischnura asiatica]